jgi:8-oxo-dGTP pyrophosphatase MutT (NUDIX family)
MAELRKALAAVVRPCATGHEVLVFRHPLAGVQLPKGTAEDDETIAEATLRELAEESGLALDVEPKLLGTWRRRLDGRFGEARSHDEHVWHISLIEAPADLPPSWSHRATGSAEEEGLVFEYHWLPLDSELAGKLHPLFGETVRLLSEHLTAGR